MASSPPGYPDLAPSQDRSERADRVAALTAGVLRDLRGPLTYLLANLQFLDTQLATHEQDLPPGRVSELRTCLREALISATQAKELLRHSGLGAAPLGDAGGPAHADLRDVLISCLKVAHTEVDHRARVVTEFGHVPAVRGSEACLSRLFLNLLLNAAQAVSGAPEGAAEIRVVTRRDPDHGVTVEISDSGPGIPREHLGRVFEPYFTTKPAGEGVGLGLTVCRYLTEELGGAIAVDSTTGRGTTVRVTLPLAEPPSHRDARRAEAGFSTFQPPVRSLPRRHLR